MKKEANFYSGIKKSTTIPEKESLGWFYRNLLQPVFIIVAGILFAIIGGDLFEIYEFICKNNYNHDGLLLIILFVVSFFALIRAYQSLYLANLDYSTLRNKKRDYVTFTAVVIIFLCFELLIMQYNKIIYLFTIYTLVMFIATINFWDLFSRRLKKQENEIDYICEKKIQFFNAIVFSILTILFFSISILKQFNIGVSWVYMSLAVVTCILFILNIVHSHQLTFIPKIILCNDRDIDVERLKINRMSKRDVNRITDTIINEFKYIFEFVFDTSDEKVLRCIVCRLVKSCFGFGFLGYMNFYSIKQSDSSTEVGLMKINTRFKYFIYRFLEVFSRPIIILSQFGIKKLPRIYRHSKIVIASQPKLQNKKEFELTYFVIYEQFRNKKYGTHAINLLVNALFHSKTNNIDCSKLHLIVREFNTASLALFDKMNFERYCIEDVKEPSEIVEKQGKGIFFQYPKNND